jgi:hypothetical protein
MAGVAGRPAVPEALEVRTTIFARAATPLGVLRATPLGSWHRNQTAGADDSGDLAVTREVRRWASDVERAAGALGAEGLAPTALNADGMDGDSERLGVDELSPEEREAAALLLKRVRSDRGSIELVREAGVFKEFFVKERYGLRPRPPREQPQEAE